MIHSDDGACDHPDTYECDYCAGSPGYRHWSPPPGLPSPEKVRAVEQWWQAEKDALAKRDAVRSREMSDRPGIMVRVPNYPDGGMPDVSATDARRNLARDGGRAA